jgi:hypothetical protein
MDTIAEMAQQTKVSVKVKKKAGGYPADVVADSDSKCI